MTANAKTKRDDKNEVAADYKQIKAHSQLPSFPQLCRRDGIRIKSQPLQKSVRISVWIMQPIQIR